MTHYHTLGAALTSKLADVRAKYIVLAAKHHPDKEGGDAALFTSINQAWNILKDEKKRQEYNFTLRYSHDNCKACKGRGIRYQQHGFTTKTEVQCNYCIGSGLIVKEK